MNLTSEIQDALFVLGAEWPAGILLVKSGPNVKTQSAKLATDEDAINRAFKIPSFLDGTMTSELGVTINDRQR